MAIGSLKQNSLTFPWLLAQNKIPWLFPDFSLTIIFFPVFPVFQTLWEPWGSSKISPQTIADFKRATPVRDTYLNRIYSYYVNTLYLHNDHKIIPTEMNIFRFEVEHDVKIARTMLLSVNIRS